MERKLKLELPFWLRSQMNRDMRQYLPNYITFLSLGFGLVSIVLSVQEYILLAGLFVLICSILDSLDGYYARKLDLESTFGFELDSLTDIVCFGVAPIVLISQHLHLQGKFTFWLLPLFLIHIWSGAFRLARFNLQPPKTSSNNGTMGLTISQGGMVLALMILSDIYHPGHSYSVAMIVILVLLLDYLMVSKVSFPSVSWFVPHWSIYIVYLIAAVILTIVFSLFTMALILWLCIMAASIIRYLILTLRQEKVS